jgi:hypothetical protein
VSREGRELQCALTCLNHELLDDPMEDATVVIRLLRVLDEVLARFRRVLRKQTQMDVAVRRVDDGRLRQGRERLLFCCGQDLFARRLLVVHVAVVLVLRATV